MAHSQEDHLSEWIEVEQERDYYREQYELVQKELMIFILNILVLNL